MWVSKPGPRVRGSVGPWVGGRWRRLRPGGMHLPVDAEHHEDERVLLRVVCHQADVRLRRHLLPRAK